MDRVENTQGAEEEGDEEEEEEEEEGAGTLASGLGRAALEPFMDALMAASHSLLSSETRAQNGTSAAAAAAHAAAAHAAGAGVAYPSGSKGGGGEGSGIVLDDEERELSADREGLVEASTELIAKFARCMGRVS